MQVIAQARQYAVTAWCHRWKALAFAWLVCGLGWAGITFLVPDRYQASARVSADADAVLGVLLRGIAVDGSPTRQMEMLHRTLLNRPNLDKIIAETGLHRRVEGDVAHEVLAQRLSREIRFTQPTKNLFAIEYRDNDPAAAYEVVRTTLGLFLDAVATSDRQQIDSARQFLAEQLASYEERLREAGRLRFEFQTRYLDLLPGPNGTPSRLDTLRARMQQLRGELADARSRRDLTQEQLEAAPALLVVGAEGGGYAPPPNTTLADAERNLRELRLRYTEQHPDVAVARQLLAELRSSGAGGVRSAAPRNIARPNPLHEQLKVRMVDAEAQVAALERQVREGQVELARLEELARDEGDPVARFAALERAHNVVRRNYEELLTRRESLQIADAARAGPERTKVEVVDPPKVPSVPIGPKRSLLAAGVLAAGLGAGAALALLLVRIDGGFYTIQDLRRLGLPVIGGVSALHRSPFAAVRAVVTFGAAFTLLLLTFGAVLVGPAVLAKAIT